MVGMIMIARITPALSLSNPIGVHWKIGRKARVPWLKGSMAVRIHGARIDGYLLRRREVGMRSAETAAGLKRHDAEAVDQHAAVGIHGSMELESVPRLATDDVSDISRPAAAGADTRNKLRDLVEVPAGRQRVDHVQAQGALGRGALHVHNRRFTGDRHRLLDGADLHLDVDARHEGARELDTLALDRT